MAEPARWLRFLPRWSLIVGLVALALPVILLGVIGQQATDNALGADYVELLQAVRSPVMFRLGWMIDAIIWFLIGGSLLALGGSLRRHAPIVAVFVGVSGIAQLIGLLGGFIRLHGTSDLALAYASAAPDQQLTILSSYLDLWHVIDSHFHVAVLFSGVGFLLASWGFFSLQGFPRWLAAWLAIPGLLGLVQFFIVASGLPFSRPLNYICFVLGNFGLNFAIASALWRPSSNLVCAVSGEAKWCQHQHTAGARPTEEAQR